MSPSATPVPYVLLQARGQRARADETLNAGVVLFAPDGARVALTHDARRLAALHPDLAALDLAAMARALEAELAKHHTTLNPEQLRLALQIFAQPFEPHEHLSMTQLDADPEATLRTLMAWLVDAPVRTVKLRAVPRKKPTKLSSELRAWLTGAKVFSGKVDDVSRGKVVANYPIDPAADLYADFAVLNGKLNAIETLDMRGVEKVTPGLRGDAALKGITLDEARERVDGKRIVVYSLGNLEVARPVLGMVERYASEAWDMGQTKGRQQLADFIAGALHREQLPGLRLSH